MPLTMDELPDSNHFQQEAAESTRVRHRPLTQHSVFLIHRVKLYEQGMLQLCAELKTHLEKAVQEGDMGHGLRWLGIGKTHIEEGVMAMRRAIAEPD
jgi:hypothetical protein